LPKRTQQASLEAREAASSVTSKVDKLA